MISNICGKNPKQISLAYNAHNAKVIDNILYEFRLVILWYDLANSLGLGLYINAELRRLDRYSFVFDELEYFRVTFLVLDFKMLCLEYLCSLC